MFQSHSFNQDISKWNTAAVTDMEGMFRLPHPSIRDLSSWNVGNVAE